MAAPTSATKAAYLHPRKTAESSTNGMYGLTAIPVTISCIAKRKMVGTAIAKIAHGSA
jgi:hypothetical protein